MTFVKGRSRPANRSPPHSLSKSEEHQTEIIVILFTQSTADLHKYFNREQNKLYVCYNFSLMLHGIHG